MGTLNTIKALSIMSLSAIGAVTYLLVNPEQGDNVVRLVLTLINSVKSSLFAIQN
jgi:hypothetical protein